MQRQIRGLAWLVGCSSSTRALQSTPEGSMDSSRDALKTGRKQLAQWGAANWLPLGFAGEALLHAWGLIHNSDKILYRYR